MFLPPTIRAQLISDSMDLARANLLDYNIPLKLITVIATKDADITFVPYLTAFEKLIYLDNMLYSTSAYEQFKVNLLQLLATIPIPYLHTTRETINIMTS